MSDPLDLIVFCFEGAFTDNKVYTTQSVVAVPHDALGTAPGGHGAFRELYEFIRLTAG